MGKMKSDITLPEAYQFFNDAFGKVVPFEKIKADPDSYSSVFCEGSVALRSLLRDLWSGGIETRGCCKGHQCVHYYVKDRFGGKQDFVDQQTYLAHMKSKRYHEFTAEAHAYLAFVPGSLGDAKEICDNIEGKMKELLPELSYATNAFPDLVTISLNEYVSQPQRERFFEVLSSVMHREILRDDFTLNAPLNVHPSSDIYPTLDCLIQSAQNATPDHVVSVQKEKLFKER